MGEAENEQDGESILMRQAKMDNYQEAMQEKFQQPTYQDAQVRVKHLEVGAKVSGNDEDMEEIYTPLEVDAEGKVIRYSVTRRSIYHELLIDDMAKAHMEPSKRTIIEMVEDYCIMLKAFANANKLPLARHYNSWIDDHAAMLNASRSTGTSANISIKQIAESKKEYNLKNEAKAKGLFSKE